jgi:hypothetical protein
MPDLQGYPRLVVRARALAQTCAGVLREWGAKIPIARPWAIALGAGLLVLCGLGTCMLFRATPAATPQTPAPTPPAQSVAQPPVVIPKPPPVIPTISHIEFTTFPAVEASVTWGKTRLGRILPHKSLVITRPRDSGPLDVIVRAEGFLPVHTRAHTFGDSKLSVKLTSLDQQSTLFGYRAPLDAGLPLPPDPSLLPAESLPPSP